MNGQPTRLARAAPEGTPARRYPHATPTFTTAPTSRNSTALNITLRTVLRDGMAALRAGASDARNVVAAVDAMAVPLALDGFINNVHVEKHAGDGEYN